jgi:hypothetical protein
MNIKVITRDDGEIVGTIRTSSAAGKERGPEAMHAEIVPMPGQKMHEIDVPDDVIGIENADELHRRVKSYLQK